MRDPRRILLTGGGTAGHVNPALAIGSALRKAQTKLLYVGVRGRAEEVVVPREGIPIRYVRASGYPGARPSAKLFRFLADLLLGTLQAAAILLSFRPDVIVGTGGFASAPVIFAAVLLKTLRLLRSEVFVHEQNAVPGKLNQLVGRAADRVFLTFPESLAHFRSNGVVTGYPLRRKIGSVSRDDARRALDFQVPEGRFVVLAFGGSQGARTINRALVDALRELLPHRDRLFVVHGMGLFTGSGYDAVRDTEARLAERYTAEERESLEGFYVARPFFHDIERVYALADLVVVRGGAGSLNEVSALGLPAVVVPKANLPGDHQVMNARAMERAGAAVVLYEETVIEGGHLVDRLSGEELARTILELAGQRERLDEMAARSRGFLRLSALDEISRLVEGEPASSAGSGPAASLAVAGPPERLAGNRGLLAALEREAGRSGRRFRPASVVPDPSDLAWAKSRATSLLVSESWEDRNVGVKLLGLLDAREKVPLLLTLLVDRTPAPFLERLLLGDFEQVGFIRRNVLTSLRRLDVVNGEVEAALLLSLRDPYYEVRVEAARTAASFGERLTRRADLVRELLPLLADRNFEVAGAAAEALGRLGDEDEALPALASLATAKLWKVRAAALRGILSLVERGRVHDTAALKRHLVGFALTSTDFRPSFEIKTTYRRLLERLGHGPETTP